MTRDLILAETSPKGYRGVPGARIIIYLRRLKEVTRGNAII
jgi:hypothetical protein